MRLLLANPRGFCAGVDRAIDIVERALALFGAPIYVRHEVVHNRYVVERLRTLGAIFVEELSEVPDDATVIFSAHGVSRAVQEEAASWTDPRGPEVAKTSLVPASRSFSSASVVDLGDRLVELVHPGRGHTAGDLVVRIGDADVVLAGDLVEESADPSYGADCYPLEWPGALDFVLGLVELFLYGIYTAVVFVPLFNYFEGGKADGSETATVPGMPREATAHR